jgi:hypothetical protein
MKEQTWQEFKIKIPSKRDGKEIEFTLEQLFNDLELGNAFAEDLQLPYEKRLEAFNWLKSNVFQFISELIDKTREETLKELIREYQDNELDGKGYDFYFSIRAKIDELNKLKK